MDTQTSKRMNPSFPIVMTLVLVATVLASAASAKIARNTIDPTARISDGGRQVTVTGPVACDMGQRYEIRVTVTQRTTGAVAEGRASLTCAGGDQQWEARVTAQGAKTFEPGPATAVAVATTSDPGNTDDAHQWLVNITLEGR